MIAVVRMAFQFIVSSPVSVPAVVPVVPVAVPVVQVAAVAAVPAVVPVVPVAALPLSLAHGVDYDFCEDGG